MEARMDFVPMFPLELNQKIFSLLSAKDLTSCGGVSKVWREATNSPFLWKDFFETTLNRHESKVDHNIEINRSLIPPYFDPTFSSKLLPPLNPYKSYLCQKKLLTDNWESGSFNKIVRGKFIRESNLRYCRVVFPSALAMDCAVYPIIENRGNEGGYDFCVIRLAREPEFLCTLLSDIDPSKISVACVMRDMVVWINDCNVQCIALTSGFLDIWKIKVKTIGIIEGENDPEFKLAPFLTMDENYIIAMTETSIKIWNKKTLKNEFLQTPYAGYFFKTCCWYDEVLIYSCVWEEDVCRSRVTVFNTREALYPDFMLDGIVLEINCNQNVMTFLFRDCIQVRDRETHTLVFTIDTERYHTQHMLHKEYVFVVDGFHCLRVLNLSTGMFDDRLSAPSIDYENQKLISIFDKYLVLLSEDQQSIEVYDFEKGVKLYSLDNASSLKKIINVNENAIVAVSFPSYEFSSDNSSVRDSQTGNLELYSFGTKHLYFNCIHSVLI